jgi:hypothetical protein
MSDRSRPNSIITYKVISKIFFVYLFLLQQVKGKVAIGRARYLLNIVFIHLMVQIHSFPLTIKKIIKD